MSVQFVCVVIILICKFLVIIAENRINERCGIQSLDNPYPWLVGVEFKTEKDLFSRIQCTGALISRRHVITNARCFKDLYNGQPRMSVHRGFNVTIAAGLCVDGSNSRCTDDGAMRVPVDVVILHPDYDASVYWLYEGGSFNDIALLRLRDVVPYTNFIRPICLPSSDITHLAEIERNIHMTGLRARLPLSKLSGSLTYLDRTDCKKNVIGDDEVCATDTELSKKCLIQGGLVMNKREDHYELVGLFTFRSSCSTLRVFMNLFSHRDWIQSNMTGWSPFSDGCGRRKVGHSELIFHGEATKIGEWPWHIALYTLHNSTIKYTCGGTLISKTMVLTAAHCVTIRGKTVNPELLIVVLGKHNLIGKDLESQEVEVHQVIPHEKFAPTNHFENDIALLKLRTEVTFNDYIQPACIWSNEANERLPDGKDMGTVVGWGIDQLEKLSSQLKQSSMPKVPDITCIKRNPLFYTTVLENNKKFCAGWANGTSPCNGDSGGGFVTFVPDTAKDDSADAIGSWYVRGIVSLTAIIRNLGRCDPSQYVVFTDVDKYNDWIQKHLVNNNSVK